MFLNTSILKFIFTEYFYLFIFSVNPEIERDLKLIVSILCVEHYVCLILGAITEHPALLMPWLMMSTLVIILETVLFVSRLIVDGVCVNRAQIIIAAIMIHNWLQVFCYFKSLIFRCDL
ncbi:hypothetical protein C0J52_26042 [Blattella germanica]|nr:hypothetical protein C0J52_26042 [Blattella germanica]